MRSVLEAIVEELLVQLNEFDSFEYRCGCGRAHRIHFTQALRVAIAKARAAISASRAA